MPLERLVCHCDSCRGKLDWPKDVTLEHAATRRPNKYSYELLASMMAQQQDRGPRISTTTLTTKCLRSETLQRSIGFTADPDLLYAAFRGTLWHGQLEKFVHPQAIAEARFHVIDFQGLGAFSGSPDLVDPKAGVLYDYKFNKENPRFDYAWENHVQQLQVNRWLVDNADWVEWNEQSFPLTEAGYAHVYSVDVGELDEVVTSARIRSARSMFQPIDWQGLFVLYMDDKGPKPILITRSEQVPKKGSPGTRAARVADIWPDERVEEFIREKYIPAQEALQDGVLPDIPPGFEGWAHPLCGFCPVKPQCVDRYIETEVQIRSRPQAA